MAKDRICIGYKRYVNPLGRNVAITSTEDEISTIVIEQADIPDLVDALLLFAETDYKSEIMRRIG